MLAIAPLSISTAQAAVKVGYYVGNWKASGTYVAGDLITYSNKTFLSLVKNKNKNPSSNPKAWQILGGVAADGVGVIGPQGYQGIAGSQGPQGYQGLTGLTGQQGIKGDKGDTGDIGPQGPIGLTGSQGIQGEVGAAGPQGVIGLTGLKGDTGAQGTHAIDGQHIGDTLVWNGTAWASVSTSPVYIIGDTGPDGGIVYYVDGSGHHGLAAQANDEISPLSWDAAMLAAQAYNNPACPVCWHLPTKTELELLYEHKDIVGGFSIYLVSYWSSTQSGDKTTAWEQRFNTYDSSGNDGVQVSGTKTTTNSVRSIMVF